MSGWGAGDGEDGLEEQLRRALRREADRVAPAGDGLEKIRRRVARPASGFSRRRFGMLAGAVAAAAAVAVGALAAVGVLSNDGVVRFEPANSPDRPPDRPPTERPSAPAPTRPATPQTTPSATAMPSPSGSATAPAPPITTTRSVFVYYAGATNRGLRLYRERRSVTVENGAVVRAAVTAMLGRAPLDPDYRSLWPRGVRVLGISSKDGTLTIDLSGEALDGGGDAQLSVQQLVYTATANSPTTRRVRLWIEGRPVAELWGNGIGASPLERAPQVEVLAPVWIIAPAEDAVVGRTVTIEGDASVFEATVNWEVRQSGRVVDDGFATASEGAPGRGAWAAQVTLRPGTYELRAFEVSAEDGTAMFVDTKTITVR
jgi:hypothetical protein